MKVWACIAAILMAVSLELRGAPVIEQYTNSVAFAARLGTVKRVTFDDIDTSTQDPVPFLSDHYLATHGIRISALGGGGQYVSRNFSTASEYLPVSSPNIYAPGPIGGGEAYTVATFASGLIPACVSGFGLFFLDPDYPDWPRPGMGACTVTIFDSAGQRLAASSAISGPNASQRFFGFVIVDGDTGQPTPVIAQVVIKAGTGWPASSNQEGAPMDDFTFSSPTPLICLMSWSCAGEAINSLRASGPPGTQLRLEFSTNLAEPTWLPVATNTIPLTGQLVFTNLPSGRLSLFYRLTAVQ